MLLSSLWWQTCHLPANFCSKFGIPGVIVQNWMHRPFLHRCCSVVAHNSHDLIGRLSLTATRCYNYWWWDCMGRKKRQNPTVNTEMYTVPSCAIHLNRGNKLRVVLTSFNHKVIDVFFFFAGTSKLRGSSFCQCDFFFPPRHSCFFPSHHLPHVAPPDNRLQTRGRKWKVRDVMRKEPHWEKL